MVQMIRLLHLKHNIMCRNTQTVALVQYDTTHMKQESARVITLVY